MPGDLVGVDTDANGFEGYVIDVSRTFLCGDNPSPGQKEAYRVAYDSVMGMLDLVRPGMTFAEFADKAPRLPEAYAAQRYPTMVRQAGRAVRRQAGGPGARDRERPEAHLHVPVRGGAARLIAAPR